MLTQCRITTEASGAFVSEQHGREELCKSIGREKEKRLSVLGKKNVVSRGEATRK